MADSGPPYDEEDELSEDAVIIRMLIQGDEINSLIRNNADALRRIKRETGAKIDVSDGTAADRVVTMTGDMDIIHDSVTAIVDVIEKYLMYEERCDLHKNPYVFKMLVPAVHCGPLIGKGGSKIKEMRDQSGAMLQIGDRTLPGSSERIVSITGDHITISKCVCLVANVVTTGAHRVTAGLHNPSANDILGPVLFIEGLAYTIQGNLAVPINADVYRHLLNYPDVVSYLRSQGIDVSDADVSSASHFEEGNFSAAPRPPNQYQQSNKSDSIWVPVHLIGYVIGEGNSRLNEIRNLTKATINISMPDNDREISGAKERRINVRGSIEGIALARYLITMCVELQKAALERARGGGPPLQIDPSLPLVEILTKSSLLTANVNLGNVAEVVAALGISTSKFAPETAS